jgi:hypothetical protein
MAANGRIEVETAQHDLGTAGTTVLDRYVLVEELGSGGFGAVWLARDRRLERPVAVKRIPVRGGAAGERAEREALAAARLSHPAVVQLYEAGRDDDAVYLVSELVRGTTLAELLADGALSDRDVVLIGMAMCDALAHAHARGVIHRDVKPGNVLVPEAASDGVVAKLTDFGIARITGDDALTATGDVVGTLAYMAPEQAEGKGATAASDLYALALVLYEALSGVNPIRSSGAAATARRVGMRLPALRRLRRDLPRGLCAAIDAGVLADPAMRGSTESLRLALAEALHEVTDEPGTVEAPAWVAKSTHTGTFRAQPWRRERTEAFDVAPVHPRHAWQAPAIGIPSRLIAGALAAGTVAAVLTLTTQRLPLDPAALAVAVGLAVALLPRVAWLLAAGALVALLGNESGDAWWVVGLAAAPMPLLIPHRPAWWSAPGLAVALGSIGAAAAWPAIAGQAKGIWARAVLGAAGFWTLSLVALLLQKRLLLEPHGNLTALTSDPAMATAAVWATAAAILPALTRGRNVGADLLGAIVWAAALAVGTQYAAQGGDPRGLTGAAALAALLATLAGALRRT